jgi:hypothetical protein
VRRPLSLSMPHFGHPEQLRSGRVVIKTAIQFPVLSCRKCLGVFIGGWTQYKRSREAR